MRGHHSPSQVNLFVWIALGCLVVINLPVSARLAAKWAAAGYVGGWVGNVLAFAVVMLGTAVMCVVGMAALAGVIVGYEWIRDRFWRRRP